MAIINWTKQIAFEMDAGVPGGENWSKAYDLQLFEELGNPDRLVLWVVLVLQFDFVSDDGGAAWTSAEEAEFKKKMKTACEEAWSGKFPIKAEVKSGPNTTNVAITIRTDGTWSSRHWLITVRKASKNPRNYVKDNGDVRFEDTGLEPAVPYGGTNPRVSIVHEFGHLLGYQDEYPNSDRGTNKFSDPKSIMHFGTEINERHYVFFADWLTKLEKKGKLKGTWKVNGTTTRASVAI